MWKFGCLAVVSAEKSVLFLDENLVDQAETENSRLFGEYINLKLVFYFKTKERIQMFKSFQVTLSQLDTIKEAVVFLFFLVFFSLLFLTGVWIFLKSPVKVGVSVSVLCCGSRTFPEVSGNPGASPELGTELNKRLCSSSQM